MTMTEKNRRMAEQVVEALGELPREVIEQFAKSVITKRYENQ